MNLINLYIKNDLGRFYVFVKKKKSFSVLTVFNAVDFVNSS